MKNPMNNPTKDANNFQLRVIRDGGWNYFARAAQVSKRNFDYPDFESDFFLGFRIVRNK